MSTQIKAISPVRKLIHIAGVALVMTLTLGLAVAVSGHPAENASVIAVRSAPRSTPQSALPVNQVEVPMMAATDKVEPELLHEAAVVEVKPAVVLPHTHTVKMLVTAYCPCSKCCGENASGITASGKLVTADGGRFVAADSSLPFGTKVMIPGYASSSVEVLDRGGAIRGNHIDVFFPTHEQALRWGRQMLDVTIVD